MVKHALPVFAAASASEPNTEQSFSRWSLEQAEASLMARLDAEHSSSASIPTVSLRRSGQRQAGIYLLAALVLLCCGGVLYMIQGRSRHTAKVPNPTEVTAIKPAPVEKGVAVPASARERTPRHLKRKLRVCEPNCEHVEGG